MGQCESDGCVVLKIQGETIRLTGDTWPEWREGHGEDEGGQGQS